MLSVGAHFDPDTHSIFFVDVDFPADNPVHLEWSAPTPLDQAQTQPLAARVHGL